MKRKLIMSAALLLSVSSLSGCFFFPAEEELLDPPTVAVEDIAYSTYTAKQKTIEDKITATGYVVCKTQFNKDDLCHRRSVRGEGRPAGGAGHRRSSLFI